jgi:hypothetical protein
MCVFLCCFLCVKNWHFNVLLYLCSIRVCNRHAIMTDMTCICCVVLLFPLIYFLTFNANRSQSYRWLQFKLSKRTSIYIYIYIYIFKICVDTYIYIYIYVLFLCFLFFHNLVCPGRYPSMPMGRMAICLASPSF